VAALPLAESLKKEMIENDRGSYATLLGHHHVTWVLFSLTIPVLCALFRRVEYVYL
jgi:hypothetical protein